MQITPQTKISVILKANPKAIEAIASINPHFEKLRNPILRKILASRVNIADAARIGNATVADFFEKLQPLGFESGNNFSAETKQNSTLNPEKPNLEKPADLPAKLVELDVRESLATGSDPFNEIMDAVKNLAPNQALCLINTFEPTPLIAILKKRGYAAFVEVLSPDLVHTFFYKTVADSAENPIAETKPAPENDFAKIREIYGNHLKEIDVRDLEMPLPMTTILETLPTLKPDEALFVIHRKVPQFLLPQLAERGFGYVIQEVAKGRVHLLLYPLNHHGRAH